MADRYWRRMLARQSQRASRSLACGGTWSRQRCRAAPRTAPRAGESVGASRTLDGNEAVASVAHRVSEVIAIYPIMLLRLRWLAILHGRVRPALAAAVAFTPVSTHSRR